MVIHLCEHALPTRLWMYDKTTSGRWRLMIQCWKWLSVWWLAVWVWSKPHPAIPQRLFFAPSLFRLPTFTQTHTGHAPASGRSDPLGGMGEELVNFQWTRSGNDFPLAPLLSHTDDAYCLKQNFQFWMNKLPTSTYLTLSHSAFSTEYCTSAY